MKKITGTIMILLLSTVIYLMLNVCGAQLPLPNWFNEMIKEQVDSSMAHDPFLNLSKTTIKLRNERDSLRHIVDSLKLK